MRMIAYAALALAGACTIENQILRSSRPSTPEPSAPTTSTTPVAQTADPTAAEPAPPPGQGDTGTGCALGPEPGRCVCEDAYQGCLADGTPATACEEDFQRCVANSEWPDDTHPGGAGA